ncbi:MAG: thiolase family protein [Desulfobacteraceae bacterium]|nr:MAG: thiolase family protein [Desulfobacteraceae bacterium]
MHKCGRYPEKPATDLALEAALNALDDAGIPWNAMEVAYASHVAQGVSVGEAICEKLGMTGIPIINVENACASGSTAIREAFYAIANGVYDVAIVIGVEKMNRGVLGGAGEEGSLERELGLNVMPARYALKANKHMHAYSTTVEQMAKVSVKNHKNGCLNPYAHYQKVFTVEEVLASKMICDPITLLQCCPTSDGAAAAVLCAAKIVRRYNSKPKVFIAGSALKTEKYKDDADLTARTAKAAYEMAAMEPGDIDFAELHDAFTIGEILHCESLGFCPPGEGGVLVDTGRTEIGGDIPVNPSGGLQSRGHPLGMTGVAQLCEVVWQLRGAAAKRQVESAKVGLTHTQGAGGVCSVHIFKR